VDSLAPLRDSRFRWLFVGRTVSLLGSSLVNVALAFAVLDISNSPGALGAVLAAHIIPMAVLMLFGGVAADRFPRGRVLQLSHLASGLTQASAATLFISGHATVPNIIVVEALNGAVSAFTFPALQGVIPTVVDRSMLQQANALLSFARGSATVVGPSAGALIVVTAGAGWALAFDSLTYLVAAFCMGRLRIPSTSRVAGTSMARELHDGWGEFVSRQWLWVVVAAFAVLNALTGLAWMTLGPVIAKSTVGEGAWGIVLSADTVGFFVMTLILLRLQLRHPLRAGMLGVALLAVPMAMLGLSPSVFPLIAASFLAGAGSEVFNIGWQTALQEHVPGEALSRVSAYDMLGSIVAIPVGQLLAGPLTAVFSARTVVIGSATLFVVVVAATFLSPSVRNLQRVTSPGPTGRGMSAS
jgi:MFS family permease